MTELTHFTDTTPDLTTEEKDLLRAAGADEALIQMCDAELDGIERDDGKAVERNSALEESKKYLREWESLTEEKVEDFSHLGGHFYEALWDGNLYNAYCRADGNNTAILKDVFTLREINSHCPTHRVEVSL